MMFPLLVACLVLNLNKKMSLYNGINIYVIDKLLVWSSLQHYNFQWHGRTLGSSMELFTCRMCG